MNTNSRFDARRSRQRSLCRREEFWGAPSLHCLTVRECPYGLCDV